MSNIFTDLSVIGYKCEQSASTANRLSFTQARPSTYAIGAPVEVVINGFTVFEGYVSKRKFKGSAHIEHECLSKEYLMQQAPWVPVNRKYNGEPDSICSTDAPLASTVTDILTAEAPALPFTVEFRDFPPEPLSIGPEVTTEGRDPLAFVDDVLKAIATSRWYFEYIAGIPNLVIYPGQIGSPIDINTNRVIDYELIEDGSETAEEIAVQGLGTFIPRVSEAIDPDTYEQGCTCCDYFTKTVSDAFIGRNKNDHSLAPNKLKANAVAYRFECIKQIPKIVSTPSGPQTQQIPTRTVITAIKCITSDSELADTRSEVAVGMIYAPDAIINPAAHLWTKTGPNAFEYQVESGCPGGPTGPGSDACGNDDNCPTINDPWDLVYNWQVCDNLKRSGRAGNMDTTVRVTPAINATWCDTGRIATLHVPLIHTSYVGLSDAIEAWLLDYFYDRTFDPQVLLWTPAETPDIMIPCQLNYPDKDVAKFMYQSYGETEFTENSVGMTWRADRQEVSINATTVGDITTELLGAPQYAPTDYPEMTHVMRVWMEVQPYQETRLTYCVGDNCPRSGVLPRTRAFQHQSLYQIYLGNDTYARFPSPTADSPELGGAGIHPYWVEYNALFGKPQWSGSLTLRLDCVAPCENNCLDNFVAPYRLGQRLTLVGTPGVCAEEVLGKTLVIQGIDWSDARSGKVKLTIGFREGLNDDFDKPHYILNNADNNTYGPWTNRRGRPIL